MDQNFWRSFQFHTRDMASWQAPFSLVNLTWILGAFFGAIVGLGRAYLPEEAGLQVIYFLKKGKHFLLACKNSLELFHVGKIDLFSNESFPIFRLKGPLTQTKEAVTNMNVWVREVHGPNGSAPCGPWVLGLVLLSLLTAFAGASVGPEPVVIIMPSVLYVAGCCEHHFLSIFFDILKNLKNAMLLSC